MGARTVKAMPMHKFRKKKMSCSPSKLGRAKISIKPNAACLNIFPCEAVPSTVRGGWGMKTNNKMTIARMNVATSSDKIPSRPINGSSAPAI